MRDKVKLYRRIANLSRWEFQKAGAELAREVNRLRQWQKHYESLEQEFEALNQEQLNVIVGGNVDAHIFEGARGLAEEIDTAAQAWQVAIAEQRERVVQCRQTQAKARQKQRKTEDKHRESIMEAYMLKISRESNEVEGIYVANIGRRK